jgi:uncharacterized protein with HEPN domain
MSKRDIRFLLEDILESIDKIITYTLNLTYTDFIKDPKTIDAVVRNIEIIGEAANKIPKNIQKKYPDIEWHKIISMRNRIIHEYFGVDNEILWNIISKNLYSLRKKIKNILDSYQNDEKLDFH